MTTPEDAVFVKGATIGTLRRLLARRLTECWGRDTDRTADLDAKLLLAHALGMDPSWLAPREHDVVPEATAAAAWGLVQRRLRGEPVARIVGTKEFWGLSFSLSPGTLVPRPDTETVVETALGVIVGRGKRLEPLRILDLGTGSGCILLALLSELPNAEGIGIDLSDDAVATAALNSRRLHLEERAKFAVGNWVKEISGPYDAIVANPPYVEEAALPDLPVEVVGHDPRLALAGGQDGLDSYRAIVPVLPRLLGPDGFAVLEFGPRQAAVIAEMASAAGMAVEVRKDLGGRERAALLKMVGTA